MPIYEKGSEEAKAWAKKMKDAREAKKGDVEYQKKKSERKQMKKEDVSSKKAEQISKEPKVEVDVFGTDELILPEYFAVATKNGYKLVNPLTKERHISTRGGRTPFKLTRKAVDGAIYVDNKTEPIPISLFAKKDIPKLEKMLADIQKESDKEPRRKPKIRNVPNKMRGRPEILPKNIEYNAEQKEKQARGRPKKKVELVIEEDPPILEEKEEEITITPKTKKVTPQKRLRGRPKGVSKYGSEEEKKQALNKLKYESNLKKRREKETPEQTLRRTKKELKDAQKLEKLQAKRLNEAPPFRPNPKPNIELVIDEEPSYLKNYTPFDIEGEGLLDFFKKKKKYIQLIIQMLMINKPIKLSHLQ